MQKIKTQRTADCVVGGFRYLEKKPLVGSLLLGLYNNEGLLDHHFVYSFGRTLCPDQETRKAHQAPWIHRKSSRWAEPLEHKAFSRMAAARSQTGLRSPIRSLHRRPLPPRNKISALAHRKIAKGLHHATGASRKSLSPRFAVKGETEWHDTEKEHKKASSEPCTSENMAR